LGNTFRNQCHSLAYSLCPHHALRNLYACL
jgi:hypothetical protein